MPDDKDRSHLRSIPTDPPGQAILPYGEGENANSGWSGTDTSEDRAKRADLGGLTAERQMRVIRLLRTMTHDHGITVAELRAATGWHHGVASSALSTLHKGQQIARLAEKRGRCHIYVLPSQVNGRETQPQGVNQRERLLEDCYALLQGLDPHALRFFTEIDRRERTRIMNAIYRRRE